MANLAQFYKKHSAGIYMKKISISIFLLCISHLAFAMDEMSCDWGPKDVPDYNMIIDQLIPAVSYPLVVSDTVVKLEPLEEPHTMIPFLPQLPQAQAMQGISYHNSNAPITIKQEDSISEYIPPTNPRKKRNRDVARKKGSSSALAPSRIPGRFTCPECPAERPTILRYKWGLTSHIKRVHRNIKRWGCPFFNNPDKKCYTTFKTNSDYRRHLRDQHQSLYTEVKKRILKKSDYPLFQNNRTSTFRTAVVALANRPYTRSITRALKSDAE